MNSNPGCVRGAGVVSVLLLCCSVLIPAAGARAKEDPDLLLQVDGDSVSATISAKPLAEVARALATKTGVTMRFQAPELKDQTITVQFEKLALEAALRAILKDMNYAMVTALSEQGTGIRVYVSGRLADDGAELEPAAAETDAAGPPPDPAPEVVEVGEKDPTQAPPPPEVFNPDPAARSQELTDTVALYGSESLALVLSAAADPDPRVRSASEQLLLNDLRDVVPKETLATIVLTSESVDNRLQALETLAGLQGQAHFARMTLDSALRDSDLRVQQRAQELLQELSGPKSGAAQ